MGLLTTVCHLHARCAAHGESGYMGFALWLADMTAHLGRPTKRSSGRAAQGLSGPPPRHKACVRWAAPCTWAVDEEQAEGFRRVQAQRGERAVRRQQLHGEEVPQAGPVAREHHERHAAEVRGRAGGRRCGRRRGGERDRTKVPAQQGFRNLRASSVGC